MQHVAAARTDVIVDVDHHLDPRQMRWKRSTVHAALGGAIGSLGRSGLFTLCRAARRHLLDVFEAKQQLILRQRLGPSAEAMPLQLLDDLFQPLGARSFRQQHRLQRAGIVRERVRHHHHGAIRA
jgi:hypothetical protein